MERKGISQEGLKVLACVSMLLDHIGAVLVTGFGLRIVGRIAFPIYCFLLAEGAHHTRDPRKYGIRLAVGMLLSEIPFDMALFGRFTWQHQSVMVTMLLGFLALMAVKKIGNPLGKMIAALAMVLLAEYLRTDYGGHGVLMILLFGLSRNLPGRSLWQTLGLGWLCWAMGSFPVPIGPVRIPIELFAVLAMLPISLYHGEKRTRSKVVQRGFYLFYPVHLGILALVKFCA